MKINRIFINPEKKTYIRIFHNKLNVWLLVVQGAVQVGQVKMPPGYHPFDVEKEWGRLHVAILERERLLRTEFER